MNIRETCKSNYHTFLFKVNFSSTLRTYTQSLIYPLNMNFHYVICVYDKGNTTLQLVLILVNYL